MRAIITANQNGSHSLIFLGFIKHVRSLPGLPFLMSYFLPFLKMFSYPSYYPGLISKGPIFSSKKTLKSTSFAVSSTIPQEKQQLFIFRTSLLA
jgi:hypothetical protein